MIEAEEAGHVEEEEQHAMVSHQTPHGPRPSPLFFLCCLTSHPPQEQAEYQEEQHDGPAVP